MHKLSTKYLILLTFIAISPAASLGHQASYDQEHATTTSACAEQLAPLFPTLDPSKPFFERLQKVTHIAIPPEAIELARAHPLAKQKWSQRRITLDMYAYSEKKEIMPTWFGESIQTSFITSLFQKIFKNIEIVNFAGHSQRPSYIAPQNMFFRLGVGDSAEFAQTNHQLDYDIQMADLKPANPIFSDFPKDQFKKHLKIPKNKKIVSLYIKKESHEKNDTPYTRPSLTALMGKMESSTAPDIVFYSSGGEASSRSVFFKKSIPNKYNTVLLSEMTGFEFQDNQKYFVINDLKGLLPYLYALSDIAIIIGPINLFEAINIKTPTLFFDNPDVLFRYDSMTFKKMAHIAQKTGIGFSIKNIEDFIRIYPQIMRRSAELSANAKPPYLVEYDGQSTFYRLLNKIQKVLVDQSKDYDLNPPKPYTR